jgi:L-gulonolactone oxidase
MPSWRNWCRSVEAHPNRVVRPNDAAEVVAALDAPGRIRPVGAGHSFSAVALAEETLLDLRGLDRIIGLDPDRGTVRAQGGVTMRALTTWLAQRGKILRQMGTSWYPTLAGATATGTHGTGGRWGSVSDAECLRGLTLITPDGERRDLRDDREGDLELLEAARTHLGALGVVVDLELAVEPGRFVEVREEPLGVDEALDPSLRDASEHFEAWCFPYTGRALGISRNVVDEPRRVRRPWPRFLRRVVGEDLPVAALLRAIRARPARAPALMGHLARFGARSSTSVGRWDRMMVGPRWLRGTSMEIALPATEGPEAVRRIARLADEMRATAPHHLPVNLRWARGDRGAILSPAAGRDTVFLDFTWWVGMPDWHGALKAIETALAPLGGRPHWGKIAFANPSAAYPGFDRWSQMRAMVDPAGRFLNPFLERLLDGRALIQS